MKLKTKFDRKVITSEMESKGLWKVTLECNHKCYSHIRKDALKHPKIKFCSQCFERDYVHQD